MTGWNLPPGCTTAHIDAAMGVGALCDTCGRDADVCICPECPICGEVGDPSCYHKDGKHPLHSLDYTLEQEIGLAQVRVHQLADQFNEAVSWLNSLKEKLNEQKRAKYRETKQREAKRRKLKKEPFTSEEKARWAPMMHSTWYIIGSDAEVAMRESGQRLTKAVIVEFVCDANRVQEYGGMTDSEYEFMSAIYDRPDFKRWVYRELNY